MASPPPSAASLLPFMAEKIELRPVADLLPDARNARTHSTEQVEKLAEIIRRVGWTAPIFISAAGKIIAGHGRLLAAKLLGLAMVPCIVLPHLTDDEARAYMLADNRLAELATWDDAMLKAELLALSEQGHQITALGWNAEDLACLKALAEGPAEPVDSVASSKSYDLVVSCASVEEQARAAQVLKRAKLTFHKFQAD